MDLNSTFHNVQKNSFIMTLTSIFSYIKLSPISLTNFKFNVAISKNRFFKLNMFVIELFFNLNH